MSKVLEASLKTDVMLDGDAIAITRSPFNIGYPSAERSLEEKLFQHLPGSVNAYSWHSSFYPVQVSRLLVSDSIPVIMDAMMRKDNVTLAHLTRLDSVAVMKHVMPLIDPRLRIFYTLAPAAVYEGNMSMGSAYMPNALYRTDKMGHFLQHYFEKLTMAVLVAAILTLGRRLWGPKFGRTIYGDAPCMAYLCDSVEDSVHGHMRDGGIFIGSGRTYAMYAVEIARPHANRARRTLPQIVSHIDGYITQVVKKAWMREVSNATVDTWPLWRLGLCDFEHDSAVCTSYERVIDNLADKADA